jgi:hypothetical protein
LPVGTERLTQTIHDLHNNNNETFFFFFIICFSLVLLLLYYRLPVITRLKGNKRKRGRQGRNLLEKRDKRKPFSSMGVAMGIAWRNPIGGPHR